MHCFITSLQSSLDAIFISNLITSFTPGKVTKYEVLRKSSSHPSAKVGHCLVKAQKVRKPGGSPAPPPPSWAALQPTILQNIWFDHESFDRGCFLRSLIGRLDHCVGSSLPFSLHQLLQQDMVSVCLARLCQKNVKQNLKNSVISDSSVPPDASWAGWQMSGEEVRKQTKGVWLQHLSWHRSVGLTNPSANQRSDRTKSPPKSIFSGTFLYSFVDRLWGRDDFNDEHESRPHFCSFNLSPDCHWQRHSWSVSLLSVMDGKDMADVTLRHSLKFLTTLTLMTTTGACVWAAIAITCHQIYQYLRYPSASSITDTT